MPWIQICDHVESWIQQLLIWSTCREISSIAENNTPLASMVEFAISSLPCSALRRWFAAVLRSRCSLHFSASLSFIFDSPLGPFCRHANSLNASFPPAQSRIQPSAVGIDRWQRYPNELECMVDKEWLGWRGTRPRGNLGSRARRAEPRFWGWDGEWFLSQWEKRGNIKNIGEDKSYYALTNSTN